MGKYALLKGIQVDYKSVYSNKQTYYEKT